MRPAALLLTGLGALVVSVLVYRATGGHFVFLALPLVLALPLLRRRRG